MTTATLYSEVWPISTCADYSVFKTHLLGLSQTVIHTQRHLLFPNNSTGCQSNFTVSLKLPLWLISFFTVIISTILVLFCLLIWKIWHKIQRSKLKVPGVSHIYPSLHESKNHNNHSFTCDTPTVWNDLPDDVHSAPTLACFRKKEKKKSLQKVFPAWHINYVASLWYRPVCGLIIINLVLVSHLGVCLRRDYVL